jgi:hypothetical protein
LAKSATEALLRAHNVILDFIKTSRAKRLVYRVYLERMNMNTVQQTVKLAAKDTIKLHLAMPLVWLAKSANTWIVWVLSIAWSAIQVISKMKPEQHRAKNVLKIRLPTSVGCRLVILVELVKKVILEVPNAPVAMRVKPVLALVVLVKNVRQVNHVHPMIKTLLRAHHVIPDIIKQIRAKYLVYPAYLERMKMTQVQQNVKIAALDNIQNIPDNLNARLVSKDKRQKIKAKRTALNARRVNS